MLQSSSGSKFGNETRRAAEDLFCRRVQLSQIHSRTVVRSHALQGKFRIQALAWVIRSRKALAS